MDGRRDDLVGDPAAFEEAAVETRPQDIQLYDIVLDTSTSLMSAEPDEFETKLRWVLQSVGTHVGADRAYVFYGRNGAFERTSGWAGDGFGQWDTRRIELEAFAWLRERLEQFENVVVQRPDLPETARLRELLQDEGVGAAVFLPMVDDWSLEGFVGFDTAAADLPWSDTEVDLLRTVADMVCHSMARVRRERTLREQNERLETFASVVSHDLRNPLNVVEGSLEVARDEHDSEHLDRAARAVDRMDDLIDQVLTLARQGRDISEPRRTRLDPIVQRAWTTVDAPDADLRLDGDLGIVEADPDRLQEAFENLFRNAVEHSSTSPPSPTQEDAVEHSSTSPPSPTQEDADDGVTIRCGPTEEGFYVADDGPGIPPEQRDSVFERGYTTDDGSGLGLSIVQNIVEAHGWTISVGESDDGGARFEVSGLRRESA
ncbi:MAG: sensor histidine kinase [Haloquadratum sp.]